MALIAWCVQFIQYNKHTMKYTTYSHSSYLHYIMIKAKLKCLQIVQFIIPSTTYHIWVGFYFI